MAKKSTTEGSANKSQIVRELLDKGVTAPKQIAEAAKTEYSVDITPAYASIIKSNLKKGGAGKGKSKKHLAPRKAPAATAAVAVSSGSYDVENAALKLALKAGSIANAIKVLQKLES